MKKLILLMLTFAACQHDDVKKAGSSADYIIFGHFYGECIGEGCVELYKLTPDHLYEDTMDRYPNINTGCDGNFQLLDDSIFEMVKGLEDAIPQDLVNTNQRVIGQPDAADGGGIYFEISADGERNFWLIDKMEGNLPDYLIPFVKEIEDNILLINK